MTAGKAIEMAMELRPNSSYDHRMMELWLRECDARLRRSIVDRSETDGAFDAIGADVLWNDGLQQETELLAPEAAAGLYPHWLCAQTDFALGEMDRAANEMQMVSEYQQKFACWMRQNYRPKGGVQFRY